MSAASAAFVGDLGSGLIRRWSTPDDADALGELLGSVFRAEQDPLPNPRAVDEMRRMMAGDFPYMTPHDVALVEDTGGPERRVVACTCLWRHRWSFAGIPFRVTRPEMVATLPELRNRGLVRAMFEMIHARGEAEGHLLQAITGIPYFYRQFGYEYVLDLDGARTTHLSFVPEQIGGEREACSLRPATLDDVPQIVSMYQQGRDRSLVWHEPEDVRWRWMIESWEASHAEGHDAARNAIGSRFHMLVDPDGAVLGTVLLPERRYGESLRLSELWFDSRARIPELMPSLLRAVRDHAVRTPGVRPGVPACTQIRFELGRTHPAYDVLGEDVAPRFDPPYAWYIRVPDVPAFLRLIAPVLEERLARSVLTGYTGTLVIDRYREAHELRFDDGRLAAVEPWQRGPYDGDEWSGLSSPPLVFLQLLLGYRSFDELRAIHPDVGAEDQKRLLIDTLFPKLPSFVEPLG